MRKRRPHSRRMFIDATYEGDLLACAGVQYTVGREPNAQYKETLNGVAPSSGHNFRLPVDPYVRPGDPASGLLKGITADPPGERGDGDRRVQAYNFRMYLTKSPDRIPFSKPAHYDADRYTLLARYIAAGAGVGDFMQLHEGDSNNEGGFSTDNIGGSSRWPEADYATREAIFQDHVSYQQGMMWFVTHDPHVPAAIRQKIGEYGLAPDEFSETARLAPSALRARGAANGLWLCDDRAPLPWHSRGGRFDRLGRVQHGLAQLPALCRPSHGQETGRSYAVVKNEGDVQVHVPGPYPIAYRAIIPRAGVRQSARSGVPFGQPHRVRFHPHGAGVHGARPKRGDRGRAGD